MKTDDAILPDTADALVARLRELRLLRQKLQKSNRSGRRRTPIRMGDRQKVLDKTDGRCHICGGLLTANWQADHVLAYSGKGQHQTINLLPAHSLCNNYRWDYLPEEFQWILKIGVWSRTLMRKSDRSHLGREMAVEFFKYETKRLARQRKRPVHLGA